MSKGFAVSFALILPALLAIARANVMEADSPPPSSVTPTANVTFESDVKPVLEAKCGQCHVEQSKGGLSFKSRESLLAGGKTGPVVKPGNADKSLLYEMAAGKPGLRRMPPRGEGLTDAQLTTLKDWINAGAK